MLIEPSTNAATASITLASGQTLQVRGILLETIDINIPDGAGGWQALTEEANAVVLDADNLQLVALGNTLVQVSKPVTVNAVGVKVL